MDRTYIDENHLVDRYVQNKLTGDELDDFEIYMLEHPEIVDEVEFAEGMHESLASANQRLFSRESPVTSIDSRRAFWHGRQYAVAATLLLAIAVVYLGALHKQTSDLQREIADLKTPLTVTREVSLEPVRGVGETTIEQKPGETVLLRIYVGPGKEPGFAVNVRGTESGIEWSKSRLKPGEDQSIRLLLPKLPADAYLISIYESTIDNRRPLAQYRILLQQPAE